MIAIDGSEGQQTYRLTVDDLGKYVCVGADVDSSTFLGVIYSNFVGPIIAGPARLLNLSIIGQCKVGSCVIAIGDYIGGKQGRSQYWWMRVTADGDREQISEPTEIIFSDSDFNEQKEFLLLNPSYVPNNSDSRFYLLTEKDISCELKVKCRPFRSDGISGEVFTSKASGVISSDLNEESNEIAIVEINKLVSDDDTVVQDTIIDVNTDGALQNLETSANPLFEQNLTESINSKLVVEAASIEIDSSSDKNVVVASEHNKSLQLDLMQNSIVQEDKKVPDLDIGKL